MVPIIACINRAIPLGSLNGQHEGVICALPQVIGLFTDKVSPIDIPELIAPGQVKNRSRGEEYASRHRQSSSTEPDRGK